MDVLWGIGGMTAGVALSTVVNMIDSQTKAFISGATTEVTALGKDAGDTLTVVDNRPTARDRDPEVIAAPLQQSSYHARNRGAQRGRAAFVRELRLPNDDALEDARGG